MYGLVVRLASYVGNDTWMQIGGPRITEFEGKRERGQYDSLLESIGLEPPQAPGVMYGLVTFTPGERTGDIDLGYADPKEAMETLRQRGMPETEIVTIG
jgi:hypothetical protein